MAHQDKVHVAEGLRAELRGPRDGACCHCAAVPRERGYTRAKAKKNTMYSGNFRRIKVGRVQVFKVEFDQD